MLLAGNVAAKGQCCGCELCTLSGGVWCFVGLSHNVLLCGKGGVVVRSSRTELGAGSGQS